MYLGRLDGKLQFRPAREQSLQRSASLDPGELMPKSTGCVMHCSGKARPEDGTRSRLHKGWNPQIGRGVAFKAMGGLRLGNDCLPHHMTHGRAGEETQLLV